MILRYCDTEILWHWDTMILRFCDTEILWYWDTVILRFCDTVILWYWDSVILRYCDTEILWYWDSVILRFCDTEILWYWDSVILSYCDTEILWYWDTMILRFCDTEILWHWDTVILRYYDTEILWYWVTVILRYCDFVILRYCDTEILWHWYTVILRNWDTVVLRYCDTEILWYRDTEILWYCDTEILWCSEHRKLLTQQHSGKSEKPWTAASQMWERQISVYHIPDCSQKFRRQSTTYRICDATANVRLGKLSLQTAVVTLYRRNTSVSREGQKPCTWSAGQIWDHKNQLTAILHANVRQTTTSHIPVGADRVLLAGRSTVRVTVEARHFFSSTKKAKPTAGSTRPLIKLVPNLSREYSGRNVILVTYISCQRARVKNEWRHTSAPPICLRGVDRESFTVIVLFIYWYLFYLTALSPTQIIQFRIHWRVQNGLVAM